MYLTKTGPVYPAKDVDSERLCGECHARPAGQGDWLCTKCRERLDAIWREARESMMEYLNGEERKR